MPPEITIMDYVKLAVPIITATGGAAGLAVKLVLNGSAKRIEEIHSDVKEARRERHDIRMDIRAIDTRLVRVETLVDPEQAA